MGKAFQAESQTYDNDIRGKNVLICPEDTNPATMSSGYKDFLSYGLSSSIASEKKDNYYHSIPRHRLVVGSSCGKSACPFGTIRKGPQTTFITTDSFNSSEIACWGYGSNSHFDTVHPRSGIAPAGNFATIE